jgi:hypothetical protein
MGVSRLLAKAWIVTCLFAGAHALRTAVLMGAAAWPSVLQVLAAVLLFAAMGLLFVGGYGVSRDAFHARATAIFKPDKTPRTMPMFNDVVFLVFAALSFVDQVWYAPHHLSGRITEALENALYFAIPGNAVVADRLSECAVDGGRVFASSIAWFLALIFAASAVSRLKHTANAMRVDRMLHPQSLSPTGLAAVLGIVAVIGIQCLFVGAPLALLPCSLFIGLPGALLIGFAPLGFAYIVYAALAALLASGGDKPAH